MLAVRYTHIGVVRRQRVKITKRDLFPKLNYCYSILVSPCKKKGLVFYS